MKWYIIRMWLAGWIYQLSWAIEELAEKIRGESDKEDEMREDDKACPRPGCAGTLDQNDRCRICGTTPPGYPA